MDRLAQVFTQQDELIAPVGVYQNEYEAIKELYSLPAEKRQRFQELTLLVLVDLEQPHDRKSLAERSRMWRDRGNRLFRSSAKELGPEAEAERVLGACRLYTRAVLEAEDVEGELCFAFANRGMALQEYGYYQEAYDDCANALEFGYPRRLQHKIIIRQAHCASKLKRTEQLAEHIACLDKLELNESFRQQLEDLKKNLELLQSQSSNEESVDDQETFDPIQEIIKESGSRGRYMIAKEAMPQGKIIFREQATCFVPLEQRLICQQCASSLMCAPIPCPQCRQRVVYCCRGCRERHEPIHRFECVAYRKDLLKMVGVSHLALRMVLSYMPSMVPQLQACPDSSEMWSTLMTLATGADKEDEQTPQYLQSLRMISHLDKAPQAELVYHMLCANLLQLYLKEYTDYFDQFQAMNASLEDWHLIVAALILRSAGQLLVNGHVGDALLAVNLEANEFGLLQPDMWRKPRHLKLGQLHNLSQTEPLTAINLPYLSLCNHACAPSIRTKFDGCTAVSYSAVEIGAGEEIFNCYTMDYKKSMICQRSQPLQQVYKFDCSCEKCTRPDPDQDYFKFHRYRCDNPNCLREFSPEPLPHQTNLNWWMQRPDAAESSVSCPVCKETQVFAWYNDFMCLIDGCGEVKARRALYKAFDGLDKWLLGHHILKRKLAEVLIEPCFAEMDEGCVLDDVDLENLTRIIETQLEGTAAQSGANSMEYLSQMTYLWDLWALSKCKRSDQQLQEMRGRLEYLAAEQREIFENYYNEFIEQQCK
ncbi:SET and MYND domain-containing protein 4 [Drosophila obscura]|uniref:SET and MYND domain-containing protein 4 n=1 Tax=Drosophila obscura TaxID=7282 RepID=UPI001BB201E8|nr:SET and MYND domain-containing protein 4 [Drosophila obscura]